MNLFVTFIPLANIKIFIMTISNAIQNLKGYATVHRHSKIVGLRYSLVSYPNDLLNSMQYLLIKGFSIISPYNLK